MEVRVSSERIEKYLKEDDIDRSYITYELNPLSDVAISIENGSFYWVTKAEKQAAAEKNKEELKKTLPESEHEKIDILVSAQETSDSDENVYVLKNINLKIKKGSFVAILGEYMQFDFCNLKALGAGNLLSYTPC